MKTALRLVPWLALVSVRLAASPDAAFDGVREADDAHVAALVAADRGKLEPTLSADLRYCHSNGTVDGKASFIDRELNGKARYVSWDFPDRKFVLAAPGIVLESGRSRVTPVGSHANVLNISFLAVWRNEGGVWRLLAWQSCKLPDSGAAAK
jgi:hypothetical protein